MVGSSQSDRSTAATVFLAVAVALGVTVLGALILWAIPAALTRHPSGDLTSAERLRATNDVRAPLVGLLVAVGAVGTLWFTSRTYLLNRQGQVTDRYTRAVEQLSHEDPAVRIGGVYALGRVAGESQVDRAAIIDVLGAFIRDQSKVPRRRVEEPDDDVRAALRVAAEVLLRGPALRIDLRDVDLHNCDLSTFPMSQACTAGARLDGTGLPPGQAELSPSD